MNVSMAQERILGMLRRIINGLYPDGSWRNILTLSGGSVVGQIIVVATSPVISRLYDPAEFGVFSIFFSMFGIISIVSTLQMQNAIPLPERDSDGAGLLGGALVILTIFSVSLLVLLLSISDIDTVGFRIPGGNTGVILFLPAAIAVANANVCLQFWALRKKRFARLAIVKGLQSATMAGAQIALGLVGLGAPGLIIGHILGQAAGILQLTKGLFTEDREAFSNVRRGAVRSLLWTNRSFATIYTPSTLLNASTIYLPAIVIGYLYGSAVAGAFAFGLQLARAGINIVVQSIARVFLVDSIDSFNAGDVKKIESKGIRFSIAQFLVGAPIFVTILLFGEEIFGFLFGARWAVAGEFVRLMTPHLMALFIFDHLVTLFVVTGAHKAKLVWDAMRFGILISMFVAARTMELPPEAFVLYLSVGWGILHAILVPMTFRIMRTASSTAESTNEAS